MAEIEVDPAEVLERQRTLKTLTICTVVMVSVVVATGLSVMISLLLQPDSEPNQTTLKMITDLQSRIEDLQTGVKQLDDSKASSVSSQSSILGFMQHYEERVSHLARKQTQIYDQLMALELKTQENEALSLLGKVAEVAMEAHAQIERLTKSLNSNTATQRHLQQQLRTTREQQKMELEATTTWLVDFINITNGECLETSEKLQIFVEDTKRWMENSSYSFQRGLNKTRQEIMDQHRLRIEKLASELHDVESFTRNENKNISEQINQLIASVVQVENLTQAFRSRDEKMDFLLRASRSNCFGSALYKYNPHSDTCYRVVNLTRSWQGAKEYCEAVGERLATFFTSMSSSWFLNQCQSGWCKQDMWVGGYRHAGNWYWAISKLGSVRATHEVQDVDWAHGEPDSLPGSAVCMQSWAAQMFKFDDTKCSMEKSFICEFA